MRGDDRGNENQPRSWHLSGSVDGKNWYILSQHNDDHSVQMFVNGFWDITGCTNSWRFLRI